MLSRQGQPSCGVSYRSPVKIASELLWTAVARMAGKYASGRLVDVGCGTKPYEVLFRPHIASYFGIDWQGACEPHYGAATRADMYVDCLNTGLEAESFDTLLATQVMEHVFETETFLAECHRLLKTGGVGIFTVPFVWQVHGEPFDYFRFTKYALEKLFTNAGFRIESMEPIGGAYATLIQMKLISIYYRPLRSFFWRVARRLRNEMVIPVLNLMAIKLDKHYWNDSLCLNYVVVVRK
jgi:SAM-dependent methyltransferase